jgi:hypothetical protein
MSIKTLTKVCSVAALLLLVFAALGPGKWIPRSGYGWQVDHFVCYFAFTLMICLAWPRALLVGGAMAAFAVLLEGMQAFTPDRIPDVHAALYSAGGVLAAALPAHLFMRAPKRLNDLKFLMSPFVALRWSFWNSARTDLLKATRRGARGGTPNTSIGRPIAVTLTASRRIRQTL